MIVRTSTDEDSQRASSCTQACLDWSQAPMPSHSTPPHADAIHVHYMDLRSLSQIHWTSSAAERPELSTKVEVRQSLHWLCCMWLDRQANGTYATRRSVEDASQHQNPMLRSGSLAGLGLSVNGCFALHEGSLVRRSLRVWIVGRGV